MSTLSPTDHPSLSAGEKERVELLYLLAKLFCGIATIRDIIFCAKSDGAYNFCGTCDVFKCRKFLATYSPVQTVVNQPKLNLKIHLICSGIEFM